MDGKNRPVERPALLIFQLRIDKRIHCPPTNIRFHVNRHLTSMKSDSVFAQRPYGSFMQISGPVGVLGLWGESQSNTWPLMCCTASSPVAFVSSSTARIIDSISYSFLFCFVSVKEAAITRFD